MRSVSVTLIVSPPAGRCWWCESTGSCAILSLFLSFYLVLMLCKQTGFSLTYQVQSVQYRLVCFSLTVNLKQFDLCFHVWLFFFIINIIIIIVIKMFFFYSNDFCYSLSLMQQKCWKTTVPDARWCVQGPWIESVVSCSELKVTFSQTVCLSLGGWKIRWQWWRVNLFIWGDGGKSSCQIIVKKQPVRVSINHHPPLLC